MKIEKKKENKEYMATDKNIRIITVGLNEIEKQIKQKELSLKKSELELNEYYLKDDTEERFLKIFIMSKIN